MGANNTKKYYGDMPRGVVVDLDLISAQVMVASRVFNKTQRHICELYCGNYIKSKQTWSETLRSILMSYSRKKIAFTLSGFCMDTRYTRMRIFSEFLSILSRSVFPALGGQL